MNRTITSALAAAALATVCVAAQGGGQAPAAASKSKGKSTAAAQASAPSKVDGLVSAMTLEEKLSFLYGGTDPAGYGQAGSIPGVPRSRQTSPGSTARSWAGTPAPATRTCFSPRW
jgi:beta-glucosidase